LNKIYCGTHCIPNWSWQVERGMHEGFTLWGIWGGKGKMIIEEKVYPLSKGDIFLLDYNKSIYATQSSDDFLNVKFVDFNMPPDFSYTEHKIMKSTKFMDELFSRAKEAVNSNDGTARLWLNAMLAEYNLCNDNSVRETKLTNAMRELYNTIIESPEINISIKDHAQNIYYSPDHFIREFKKAYGDSPYKLRQKHKFENACSLLIHSSLSISEISELSGFEDTNSFCKFFFQYSGKSPSKYRKEL